MKWLAAVASAMIACGSRQLETGQTVCSSQPDPLLTILGVKGAVSTHCETGLAPRTPPAWWCSTRPDGLGICSIEPGPCEWFRGQHADFTVGCQPAQLAICASGACFANAASCANAEREQGRDGQGCVALRAGERVPLAIAPNRRGDEGVWCFEIFSNFEKTCGDGRNACEAKRADALRFGRQAGDCAHK